jgi:hypothetical protein
LVTSLFCCRTRRCLFSLNRNYLPPSLVMSSPHTPRISVHDARSLASHSYYAVDQCVQVESTVYSLDKFNGSRCRRRRPSCKDWKVPAVNPPRVGLLRAHYCPQTPSPSESHFVPSSSSVCFRHTIVVHPFSHLHPRV